MIFFDHTRQEYRDTEYAHSKVWNSKENELKKNGKKVIETKRPIKSGLSFKLGKNASFKLIWAFSY